MNNQIDSAQKITCYRTITLIILKEIRLELGIHPAQVAERLGESPSDWAKIEAGENPFSMDMLFTVCKVLNVHPTAVLNAVSRYGNLLAMSGWYILDANLAEAEDYLWGIIQTYYGSQGFKQRLRRTTPFGPINALNNPIYQYGQYCPIDVFRFIVDEQFRNEQLTPLQVSVSFRDYSCGAGQ